MSFMALPPLVRDHPPKSVGTYHKGTRSEWHHLQVGYQENGKYYINNHLMFKILVHKTNGQYTRSRENMAELEAASIIEVGSKLSAAIVFQFADCKS